MEVAARTLCQEVRGEPPEGQSAVAHVIKNRLISGRWGKTLASVCLWRGQFSGWYVPSDPNFAYACALRDDDPVLLKLWKVMQSAMDTASDPTNGATHYVNEALANPKWDDEATFCGKFGRHKFYKDVE
jgi:spore germination cell wall hydrolase CwlJ-like protein